MATALSADKPLIVGSNRDEAIFFNMVFGDKSVFSLDVAELDKRMNDRYATTQEGYLRLIVERGLMRRPVSSRLQSRVRYLQAQDQLLSPNSKPLKVERPSSCTS